MEHQQVQQDISIIKEMIEKTRRETAESGHFFIFIGILSILIIPLIHFMGLQWEFPILIGMTVIGGVIGFMTIGRQGKKEKVRTYAQEIFGYLWAACGFICIMILFVFPFLNVIPATAAPVLIYLILGIGLFTTGAIYDLKFITLCSLAWWIGALLISFVELASIHTLIAVLTISIGFVLPGIIFNRKYKNRSV